MHGRPFSSRHQQNHASHHSDIVDRPLGPYCMPDPQKTDQEIDRLRDHSHEQRKAIDAIGVTVAVVQERQKAHSEQMDRIETAVLACTDLLRTQNGRLWMAEGDIKALKARRADAGLSAKWTAGISAIVSGIVAGLAAVFGGGK